MLENMDLCCELTLTETAEIQGGASQRSTGLVDYLSQVLIDLGAYLSVPDVKPNQVVTKILAESEKSIRK
jgi:hypothetical protein